MSTAQVLQDLYSLDTSSPNLSRCLYNLIQHDDAEKYLTSLQGPEVTRLVNFLDGALDVIPINDDVFRRSLHKLQAICGRHKILPFSYDVIGDLTIIDGDPVADGGFADVWEGICNGKKVCIKRLRCTQQNREAMEKAFYKEAVMWKRLKSRGIVGFIGITRKPLQLVSEWMPNGTLRDYLDINPDANRIGLLLDVAEGVSFLHSLYTTHGDIKGVNILIDYSGHARLADFGFTSVVRRAGSVSVTNVQGYSSRWAAPEVLMKGDRYTREADIFSFGMVVIEVFTGRNPFSELTHHLAEAKIIAGERPDRPQEPGLTDLVWDMTVACWTQDPAQRPSMASVVENLRECSRLCNLSPHLPTPTLQRLAEGVHNGERFMPIPLIPVNGRTHPREPQAQGPIPNDGRPTQTPIPGHPLLRNGETLIYPAGYECHKCNNTGYKSYDPSHPCRKCWDKYAISYTEPILYTTLGSGQSLNQRPLLQTASMYPSPSHSQDNTTMVNQTWNDLSSHPGHLAWNSFTPSLPSLQIYPRPPHSDPAHLSPSHPQYNHNTTSAISSTSHNFLNSVPPPVSHRPGDLKIVGRRCSNCLGRGKTLGFFMGLGNKTCNVCHGNGYIY